MKRLVLSACIAALAFAASAAPAPSLLPKGRQFKLVWQDEFDGDALDLTKWSYRTNYWGRRAHWCVGPEDGAVVVKDGLLHLKLVQLKDGSFASPSLQTGNRLWDEPYDPAAKPGQWPWMKRSAPKFMHRYGYYECRCRLQQKPGWWSAFWMQSPANGAILDPRRDGVEHDIMESFEPGEIRAHWFFYGGYQKEELKGFHTPRQFRTVPGAVDKEISLKVDKTEFHTFGLLWEPDGYTCFVDGVQDGEKVGLGPGEAVSQTEEFILVSTEARDYKWKGTADPRLKDAVGDDFVVDFVRVYDLAD